jgi:hypothetical protein
MAQELCDDEGNHTTMLRHNLLQQSYLVKQKINKESSSSNNDLVSCAIRKRPTTSMVMCI